MNDDFYEVDQEGVPVEPRSEATEPSRRSLKLWIRAVSIGLIVLIIALLVVWTIRGFIGQGNDMTQEEMNGVRALVRADLDACESEDDVDRCKSRVWVAVATERREPELCLEASASFAQDCVVNMAFETMDADICRSIPSQDGQRYCEAAVLYQEILEQEAYQRCEDLQDPAFLERCQEVRQEVARSQNRCSEFGIDTSFCVQGDMLAEILRSGTYADCSSLSSVDASACRDWFHSTDRDEDGLTAYQEWELGTSDVNDDSDADGLLDEEEVVNYETDPMNPDSDGDGYTDGQEVESGFNPLGD